MSAAIEPYRKLCGCARSSSARAGGSRCSASSSVLPRKTCVAGPNAQTGSGNSSTSSRATATAATPFLGTAVPRTSAERSARPSCGLACVANAVARDLLELITSGVDDVTRVRAEIVQHIATRVQHFLARLAGGMRTTADHASRILHHAGRPLARRLEPLQHVLQIVVILT